MTPKCSTCGSICHSTEDCPDTSNHSYDNITTKQKIQPKNKNNNCPTYYPSWVYSPDNFDEDLYEKLFQ